MNNVYKRAGRACAAICGFIKCSLATNKLNEKKVILNGNL